MKWQIKLLVGLVIGIIAYLVGNWVPIDYLRPTVTPSTVNSGEFCNIIIGFVSAIVTFLAVVVALFKEDIRKIWNYSKLDITNPAENIKEVIPPITDSQSDSSETHLEAQKYESCIEIHNIGNVPSIGAELYLERLTFSGPGYTTAQIIETSSVPISWSGSEKASIIIPPEGKKLVKIVELFGPVKQSLPTGEVITNPPVLRIGNAESDSNFNNGKWIGAFVIYSQNEKSVRFDVEIEWNGRWEKRLTEMKRYLKIERKKLIK